MPKLNAAFWRWFGDSVVRNADGSPMVMYHGTDKYFSVFDTSAGQRTEEGHGSAALGSYFSKDPNVASIYTGRYKRGGGAGGNIIPVFLSIQNPYYIEVPDLMAIDTVNKAARIRKQLIRSGYDGIVQTAFDGLPENEMTQVIAFYPHQIKSIYNDGTWDRDDPDIGSNPQRHTSSGTSNKQIAGVFKAWQRDGGGFHGINLDIGGGRYDEAQAWMSKNGIDCVNLVWDKFNRSAEHNEAVLGAVADHGGADSVTIANVLNVIDDKEARRDVLLMAEQYAKIGAPILISIYEGNKSGIGAPPPKRPDDWQNNLRAEAYEHEIASVFGEVLRSGKIFLARVRE